MAITQIIATLPAVLNDSATFYEDIAERNNTLVTTVLPSINAWATQANALAVEVNDKAAQVAAQAVDGGYSQEYIDEKKIENIASIKDFGTLHLRVNTAFVKDYHTDIEGGDGIFVYDATRLKSEHNGGTVIDPTAVFPTDWNNQTQLTTWFDSSNIGYGVWVRKYDGAVNVKWFGAKGDGITDDTLAIQTALKSGLKIIYVPIGTHIISGAGLSCPDHLTLLGAGKGLSILRLASGVANIYPILHETVIGGTIQPIIGVHIEGITFFGNGNASEPVSHTSALFRCYTSDSLTFVDCEFKYGRGYGVGLQGTPNNTNPDKQGSNIKNSFIRCDFFSNGLLEYITGTDTMDGMDIKSSDLLYVEGCKFLQNGDKGLDVRGTNARISNCIAEGNTIGISLGATIDLEAGGYISNCIATGASIAGFQFYGTKASPNTSVYSLINCRATDNVRGVIVPSGVGDVINGNLILNITACELLRNTTDGLQVNVQVESINVNASRFDSNSGRGARIASTVSVGKPIKFTGCVFSNNGSGGYVGYVAEQTFVSCLFDANGIVGLQATDNVVGIGCTFSRHPDYNHVDTGQLSRFITLNLDPAAIASASTITIPTERSSWVITGTTTITGITPSWNGREVTLRFNGILTMVDGVNLRLSSDLTTANATTLRLMCDGTNWYEISRSKN